MTALPAVVADHLEGLGDRHAHAEQRAEVAGPAADRELGDERTEHRQPQLERVGAEQERRVGAPRPPVGPDGHEPRPRRAAAGPTTGCGRAVTRTRVGSGSSPPSWANIFSKIGTMNQTTPIIIRNEKTSTTSGVGHRRLDLGAQGGVRLEHGRDPVQRLVEEAADLAGGDHAHHQRRELVGVLGQGRGQRASPSLHRLVHLAERLAQPGLRRLLLEDRQRPQQGEAGGGHRRELAGHHGQVARLGACRRARGA